MFCLTWGMKIIQGLDAPHFSIAAKTVERLGKGLMDSCAQTKNVVVGRNGGRPARGKGSENRALHLRLGGGRKGRGETGNKSMIERPFKTKKKGGIMGIRLQRDEG